MIVCKDVATVQIQQHCIRNVDDSLTNILFLRPSLFWDVTKRRSVVGYRKSRDIRSVQPSRIKTGCSEISVTNYRCTLRNVQYKRTPPITPRRKLELSLSQHSLTPRSTVLLAKLTGFQLVKKFPAFYGTRRFIIRHSQVPDTRPYPVPARSSAYPHIPLPEGLS